MKKNMLPETIHIQEPNTIKEFQAILNICTEINKRSVTSVIISFPCERSNDDIRNNIINNKKIDMNGCRFMKGNPEFNNVVIFPEKLCDDLFGPLDWMDTTAIKPHGTLICPHCGSIQCGSLNLKCDKCEVPLFSLKVLENALKYYNAV